MIRQVFCRSRLVLLIACLSAAGGNWATGQESGELFTEAPASVRCYGRVLAEDGRPIEGARVTLVAPHGVAYVPVGKTASNPAILQATTNMEGSFSLEFSSNDARFLGASPFILMVQADGFATDAAEVSMNRLLVDLPHEKTLVRCEPANLRIRGSDGKPAAGVQIRLARINKMFLPFHLENISSIEPSSDGIATFLDVDRDSLRSIYVQSETAGNQLIAVDRVGGELVATIMPTGTVNGQIVLPDGIDSSVLKSRRALVTSIQTMDFVTEGPRSFSWQSVTLDERGNFVADKIAPGTPGFQFIDFEGLTIAKSRKDILNFVELTLDNSPLDWKMQYKPAREYVFKFVGEDNEPLPQLSFSSDGMGMFGSVPRMTNGNGEHSVLFPSAERPDGQMFPQDAFGRISLEPFGVMVERAKYAGDGTPEPIRLTRSRSLTGRVIDEKGNMAAGATVEYSFGAERFNQTEKTWTDNSGRFEIRGLPPNAAVEVSARKGAAMTNPEGSAHVVAGTTGEITLVLAEQPVAAPVGRVVDRDGNPVAGATVAINRISVTIKEGFSPEETKGIPWSADLPSVITDDNGKFHYPATPGFGDRIQVNISAHGFLPRRVPFVQGSRLELIDGELQLGEYRLLNTAAKVNATVRCIDQATGQPVSGVDVVFVGVHAGRTSAKTGDNGMVSLTLTDTPQIAAARADGYSILFQAIDHVSETVELKLQRPDPEANNQRLAWFDRSRQDYRDMERGLFEQLEKPVPGESTFHRHSQYLNAMAAIEPDEFRKIMSDSGVVIEEKASILQWEIDSIARHSIPDAVGLLADSKIEPYMKATCLAGFAAMSTDPEMKDELFGEAIVGLGALSGKDRLRAAGYLARYLIFSGRVSVAKSVVQHAWDGADDYRDLLKADDQKNAYVEARVFGPVLALVDPDAALQFISLHSFQQEVAQLQDGALGVLSLCDQELFHKTCSDHNLKYAGGMSDWLLTANSGANNNPDIVAWAIRMADMLDDSTTKLALCLFAAKHLPPGAERDRLLSAAVRSWVVPEPVVAQFYADPSKFALEQLASFDTIAPHEIDPLVFVCLNSAPASFDSRNMIGILGGAARLLGMRDPKLGRALLEPAFDDSVWLFDHVGRTWFYNCDALNSTVWIDPEWAGELARQLSDRYSPDDSVRQLQLYGSVIRETESLLSRLK